ncbi:MAG: nitrous oxide reductase family maturation protein NosD [Promethearchaeota archaeon]
MKKPSKKKIITILVNIILGFSIFINVSSYYCQNFNNGYVKEDNENSLKQAGFWEIEPFEIYDDDPTRNWLITKATYDWCSGSGTLNDPYVIENVTIDGSGSGMNHCIRIQNSIAYFIINNCTLYNGFDYGIVLSSVSNGLLKENNCSNNGRSGILLEFSDNNTILNNTANNHRSLTLDHTGIRVESGSDNNTIKGNIVNNNDFGIYLRSDYDSGIKDNIIQNNCVNGNRRDGIRIYSSGEDDSCTNNVLLNNVINNNGYTAIHLTSNGIIDDNEIKRNIIKNNDGGISLIHASSAYGSCKNNIILGNFINNCTENGIKLGQFTENNNISGNNITDHDLYGLLIESNSNSNVIYNNTFIENTINALDSGIGNQWDFGSLGNCWDDYPGVDANDDGIGDTSYDVPPAGGSVDNYPIWDDGDDLAPEIIINSPSMNDAFGLTAPDFEIAINDASPINTTWYTIDGGMNNYTFYGLTGTINQTAWDNKGTEELMTLRFYANDSLGHLGFKDVSIWKDIVAPQITINAPTSNQLCGVDAPTFSLTIIEPNILSTLYSFNGRPNITSDIQAEWENIGNGTVLITISVLDKAGNVNSSEVTVRKDAYIPDVIVHSPISGETFGKTPPTFNISIIEEDLDSMWYTVEHIAGTFPLSELTGTIDQDAWSDVPEEEITFIFYAQDRAGNIGTETITVIKAIPKSTPVIPSYNLFFLLGILSVVFVIVSKKTMKK